jgi:hypothetical protein
LLGRKWAQKGQASLCIQLQHQLQGCSYTKGLNQHKSEFE